MGATDHALQSATNMESTMDSTVEPSHYEVTGKLGKPIELYTLGQEGWVYRYTTQWCRTCKEAKARYCAAYGVAPARVKARFKGR